MTPAGVSYGAIGEPSHQPLAGRSEALQPVSGPQPCVIRPCTFRRREATRFDEPMKFLPVAFIVSNMAVMYYIYYWHHLTPLGTADKSSIRDLGFRQNVVFQIITAMVALCYVRCVLVDPGSVPLVSEAPAWSFPSAVQEHVGSELERLQGQLSDVSSSARGTSSAAKAEMERIQYQIRLKQAALKLYGEQQPLEEVLDPSCQGLQEAKRTGSRRSCKWCQSFKPDRCHHCRVCRSCILKMDHHCPWIYNCVGFRNHKYFFLLLFYSMLDLNWIFWTMLPSFREALDESTGFRRMFALMFGQMLVGFLGLMVSFFFSFHVGLMLKAMTTIEFCEKSTRRSHYDDTVFDRGVWGNITAVLGDNVLTWGVPFCGPSGDGLRFSAGVDHEKQLRELADSLESAAQDPNLEQKRLAAWHELPPVTPRPLLAASKSASRPLEESPFKAARPATPPEERQRALISPSVSQVDGDTGGIGGDDPALEASDGSAGSGVALGLAPLAGIHSLQQPPPTPPRSHSPPIP